MLPAQTKHHHPLKVLAANKKKPKAERENLTPEELVNYGVLYLSEQSYDYPKCPSLARTHNSFNKCSCLHTVFDSKKEVVGTLHPFAGELRIYHS